MVAGLTLVNVALRDATGYHALSLVYLLGVVVLGLRVGRAPAVLGAAASALLWNFLFVPPLYTFQVGTLHDVLMLVMFLVVALAMGHLTARLRSQEQAERFREERATALYLLTRELAEGKNLPELLAVVVRQLRDTFSARVAVLLPDPADPGQLLPYPFGTLDLSPKELSVAAWTHRNAKPAGRSTDTLPSGSALHLPLNTPSGCLGVISLEGPGLEQQTPAQRDLLEGFVRQMALVLDRQRLRDAEQDARLVAESERLGKALLNSVSHELRTPLAAMTSAASGLSAAGSLSPLQGSAIAGTGRSGASDGGQASAQIRQHPH
jgi:two-component system sensor histidine kinase KdpD